MEPLLSTSGWLPGSKPHFIALLPPVPTIRFRSEPRFPTNDSLAEFGHHIITSLHDYSDTAEEKDLSTAFTTEPLALFNQHAINRAIQDLARESAIELARSLVPRLKAKFEDRVVATNREQISTNVTSQISGSAEKHEKDKTVEYSEVKDNAASHSKVNQETGSDTAAASPETFAEQAKPLESQAFSEFQVDSMLVHKLSQLDIIVLADDCNSAEWSTDRVLATHKTIQEIFRIATSKNPQRGVELHFFNDPDSSGTVYFGSESELKDILESVGSRQGGVVGCPLQEKILKPLEEGIDKGSLRNPTVVVIITGGGENPELAKTLGNVISDFKDNLTRHDTAPTVSFIFLPIGNGKHAKNPFSPLEQDERIQDIVRCPKGNLKGEAYSGQLVGLLAEILENGRG